MKMRLIVVSCLLLVAFPHTMLKAQSDTGKIREVGLGFSNLNSFNIAYQWGTRKTLYSFSVTSIAFSAPASSSNDFNDTISGNNSTSNETSISFSLAFSIVKAKKLSPKLDFLHGVILGTGLGYSQSSSTNFSYSGVISITSSTSEDKTYSYTPFIGVVLGVRYALSNLFYIYAEISPRIYYDYSKTTSTSTNNYLLTVDTGQEIEKTPGISNLSNTGAALMLVYRFQK